MSRAIRNFALPDSLPYSLTHEPGLVGAWDMKNQGGKVLDLSGNGNDGTIYGALDCKGITGRALKADGVGDYVATSYFNLGAISTVTMSAWVKLANAASGSGGILYKASSVLEFCLSVGRLSAYVTNSVAWHSVGLSPTYTDWDKWHHVAIVCNGINIIFYRDGVQVFISGSETGNLPSSNRELKLFRSSGGLYVDAIIDKPRIYNRALSPAEIQAEFNEVAGQVILYETLEDVIPDDTLLQVPHGWVAEDSGEFKIKEDSDSRYIECATAGLLTVRGLSTSGLMNHGHVRKFGGDKSSLRVGMYASEALGIEYSDNKLGVRLEVDEKI